MDIPKIMRQLREELAVVDEAILSLERLDSGRSKRRGRPPKWLKEAKASIKKQNEKPIRLR
jgi:hypothetical protein